MKKNAPLFLLMAASTLAVSAIDRPDAQAAPPVPVPVAPIQTPPAAPTIPATPLQKSSPLGEVWMGIVPAPVPEALVAQLELDGNPGILVRSVGPSSPAKKAGILPYDILLQVNGKPIRAAEDIIKSISANKPGDSVDVDIIRGSKRQTLKVPLEKRPENLAKVDGIMSEGNANDQNPADERSDAKLASRLKTKILPLVKSKNMDKLTPDLARKLQELQDKLIDETTSFNEDLDNMDEQVKQLVMPLLKQGVPKVRSHLSQLQDILDEVENNPGVRNLTHSASNAVINIRDNEGSIHLNKTNDNTTVSVKDSTGKVLYDGPYNTDEDKSKVPAEVRQRLDKVIFK